MRFVELPMLGLVALLLSAGCCQLTGNFGGGPCPRARASVRSAPDPVLPYRYRIQFACIERIEFVSKAGDEAHAGSTYARAALTTPSKDFTKEPNAPNECGVAGEPNLSLWIRVKGGELRSFVVPLEEKERNSITVSCENGIPHVAISHPPSPRTRCDS